MVQHFSDFVETLTRQKPVSALYDLRHFRCQRKQSILLNRTAEVLSFARSRQAMAEGASVQPYKYKYGAFQPQKERRCSPFMRLAELFRRPGRSRPHEHPKHPHVGQIAESLPRGQIEIDKNSF